MERDPSREKTQWLILLSQIVSYFQLSENKFLFAEYFPGGSSLRRGDLGNRQTWLFSFQKRKTVITTRHATKRMSMTSVARAQPAPQLGVNPIGSETKNIITSIKLPSQAHLLDISKRPKG